MVRLDRISYGGATAIVTNMALIVGLNGVIAAKAGIIGALLVVAVADNLTDSLSIHIYQESERLAELRAVTATLTNFATWFIVFTSFVLIVLLLPIDTAIALSLAWGLALLVALACLLAKATRASIASEIGKHVAMAIMVIFVSRAIGIWIAAYF